MNHCAANRSLKAKVVIQKEDPLHIPLFYPVGRGPCGMSLEHEGTAFLCLMLKSVTNGAMFAISIFMFVTYFCIFSM